MRGSERLLYIGNFNCLCAGINENESLWQIKRVVVTDAQIYFFPYTNYTIKTPKLNEDWTNYKDLPQTISQLQERTQYIKSNQLDPDSITAPPLQVQQVSDKYVQLIPIDQLINLLSKTGYNAPLQNVQGQAICLINKLSKEVQYLIAQNQADNIRFFRSIIVGNAFQKYQIFKNVNNISYNQALIAWLQESVNTPIAQIEINNEQLIPTYKLFCECHNLINGIIFKLSLSEHLKNLVTLVSSLKPDQLIRISLKNCGLQSNMIGELNPILQNCPFLDMLDLSQNQIEDRGIDQISKLFEHCLDIKTINLSQNKIQGKDLYLEVFLLKSGTILNKVSLDFSQNQLTDNSIQAIENRVLSEELSTIKHINISYNNYSRNGILRLFNLFKDKSSKGLTYKIFPLPFSKTIVEFLMKSNTKNEVIYEDSQELQVSAARRGPSLLKQPSNHHPTISQHFPPQMQQIPKKYQITFLRKSTKKLPPSNSKLLKEVKQKEESILKILETNNGQPSVEDIYQATEEIKQFQYRISHKITNQLIEMIWQKLNDALIYRDNYSISYLTFSSYNMEMDITILKEKYIKLSRRLQLIEDRINRLLNFQIEETKINKELDDLIAMCHRLDIRGTPLDLLIKIQQEREIAVKSLIYNDYQWQTEYYDDFQNDSTQFIYRDKEFINQQLSVPLPVDSNLVQHPLTVNYYQLTKLSIQQYEQNYEILYKILKYQALDFGKISTQKFNIRSDPQQQQSQNYINYTDSACNFTNFNQNEYEQIVYFAQLGLKRAKFFITNHYENFNQNLWRECSEEFQLNHARLIINYFSFQYRKQQAREKLERLAGTYQEMKLDEIIEDIDVKGINSEQRYLISEIKVKHNPIKFQQDCDHNFNNAPSMFDYPYLGSSQQLEIIDPIHYHAQSILLKQLQLVVTQYALKNTVEYDNNILITSLRFIIDICMNSPCPSLFGDELYHNLFRISLKEKQLDLSNIYYILLHYIPPSKILLPSLFGWLKGQYQRLNFDSIFHQWDQGLPMVYWLPSTQELNSRLNENVIQVNLLFTQNLMVTITPFDTVAQVMKTISDKLNFEDKGQFWIYIRIEIRQDNQQSNLIHLDLPLLSQLHYWEHISKITQSHPSLAIIVKRRIFSLNSIKFQSLSEIIDQFVNFQFCCYHYNTETITKIIILLMCIESINDQEQNLQDINVYNYIQFIPLHLRNELDIEELVETHSQLIGQLLYFDQQSLTQFAKLILSHNPALNSSIFNVKLGNQEQQMIVNYHGIFFYQENNLLMSTLFSEIIGISISSNQMRMHTYREQLNKYIISFQNEQSLECYQDILSYMGLRLLEKIETFSNYQEYAKLRYKYNLQLISSFDQNDLVSSLFDMALKNGIKNVEENYTSEFIKQFIDDIYLKKLAKRQYFLDNLVRSSQFSKQSQMIFPFQQDCPIIQFVKPKMPQSVDISNYFGKSSKQEIRRLYDPIRELFPTIEYTDDSPQSSKGIRGSQKIESLNMQRSQTLKSKGISSESRRVSKKTLELFQLKSDEKQEVQSEQHTYRKQSNVDMYLSQEITSQQNQKAEFIYKIMEEEENIKSEYSPSILHQQQKRLSLSQSKTNEQNLFQSFISDMNRLKLEEIQQSQQSATLLQNFKNSIQSSSVVDPANESLFSSLTSKQSKNKQHQTQSEQFIN